jgi:hypothetical protein
MNIRNDLFDTNAEFLAKLKEAEIRAAITHQFGSSSFTLDDVVDRGHMTVRDGIETFSFDGVDLVKFYPPEFIEESKPDGTTIITMSRKYQRLY